MTHTELKHRVQVGFLASLATILALGSFYQATR